MSVRQALLALLEQGPMYGYQLRAEFEQRTGATWPLNVGQVYTTLTRLERDGLRRGHGGRRAKATSIYRVTDPGRGEVSAWFTTPVPAPSRRATSSRSSSRSRSPCPASTSARSSSSSAPPRWPRCRTTPGSSAAAAPPTRPSRDDLAWSLVLDSLVFAAEAEIRWLDHCEARLRRAATQRGGRRERRRAEPETEPASRPHSPEEDRADDATVSTSTTSPASTASGADRGARRCKSASPSARTPASWSPSWARPAPASPRCSPSPAASTSRPPAR